MILHYVIRQALLLCFYFSFICLTQAQQSLSGVTLFSQPNFQGEHFFIDENWAADKQTNFWAENIESVFIPNGWEVWIYRDFDYRGEFKILSDSWDGLDTNDERWKNEIKGVRIIRKPIFSKLKSAMLSVTVFKEPDFKGRHNSLFEDWSAGDEVGYSWDNKIGSIAIPPGMQVIIYTEQDYKAKSKVLSKNWSANGEWVGQISSIKILTE